MTRELPKDIAEFFRKTGRMGGKIGGKRSLETMTPEQRSERAKKAAVASAEARRNGARPPYSAGREQSWNRSWRLCELNP